MQGMLVMPWAAPDAELSQVTTFSSRVLVTTPAGQICLVVGLGMEVLAGFWMRALVGGPTEGADRDVGYGVVFAAHCDPSYRLVGRQSQASQTAG